MRWWVLIGVLAAGCDDTDAIDPCVVGDPSQPLQMEILVWQADGSAVVATDESTVPILMAPSGGWFLYAGVRVRNVDACRFRLLGFVRDEPTQRVSFEARPITLEAGADGWAYPSVWPYLPQNYTNIHLCPGEWFSTDVDESTFGLELRLDSIDNEPLGSASVRVRPACEGPYSDECVCHCSADFVVGQACPASKQHVPR